jgi:5'-phosphate synthase pdxT subunit
MLRIGVLALQGDVREHVRLLSALAVDAVAVRRPEEIDDLDGIVVPGGESTTMSRLAVDFGLLDPLQKRIASGLPAYGSCAGMIMLAAEVLDGRPDQRGFGGIDMTVRRNAFGRQVDSFEAPVLFGAGPPAAVSPSGPADAAVAGELVHAVFIRAPWVERVGPDVEVLGRVSAGPAAGRIVAVRQRNVLATAFHPELTGDLRVHRLFVELARVATQSTEG